MPRYRLRTLLIVAGLLPPLAALAWLKPVYFGLLVAFLLYTAITLFVLGLIRANPARSPPERK
jgi:hypothetical protein